MGGSSVKRIRSKVANYALPGMLAAVAMAIVIALPVDVAAAATLKLTSPNPQFFLYGRSAVLKGQLATEGPTAQRNIEIQTQSTDGDWTVVCTVPTSASGGFSASVAPTRTAVFRAVSADDRNTASGAVTVIPRVDLRKLSGPSTRKRKVAWIGSSAAIVYAAQMPSNLVMVGYRLERGKWRRRATWKDPVLFPGGMLSTGASVHKFSFIVMLKFPKRGTWRIRLESRRTATYGSSVGPYKRIRVR
jgi:hypothetical protein